MESPTRGSPSSLADSAIGEDSPDFARSDFSDEREEKFECYGENGEYDSEINEGRTSPTQERNSWMRTSLRRTVSYNESSPRRMGSFRHHRQQRASVVSSGPWQPPRIDFSSSDRSSSNDEDGDMLSDDVAIEDDIIDLHNKVHQLRDQVGSLAESQVMTEDKYARVKQDNASMTARIHMLEESIRELEVRGEERMEEEKRRHKDMVNRMDREKHLELENYSIRLHTVEREYLRTSEELNSLRSELEKIRDEKAMEEEQLVEAKQIIAKTRKEHKMMEDCYRKEQEERNDKLQESNHIIGELNRELQEVKRGSMEQRKEKMMEKHSDGDELLGDLTARIVDMEEELRLLRDQNKTLNENNEDLQGQILNKGLVEGMRIIQETESSSLAAELEAMPENEMKIALQDQKDANKQLKSYIDNVLLNIMSTYPELLEVRTRK